MQVLVLPLIPGALGFLYSEWAGALAFAISFVATYAWWKMRTGGQTFQLDVGNGVLSVASSSVNETMRLAVLLAVELETKTIQRVQEGGSMIAAMRVIDAKVGDEVDTCRVVLRTEAQAIRLGEKYIAHMDAVENVGKIRVFLRKHGWLPEDERNLPFETSNRG
jgi:hypothetical protein